MHAFVRSPTLFIIVNFPSSLFANCKCSSISLLHFECLKTLSAALALLLFRSLRNISDVCISCRSSSRNLTELWSIEWEYVLHHLSDARSSHWSQRILVRCQWLFMTFISDQVLYLIFEWQTIGAVTRNVLHCWLIFERGHIILFIWCFRRTQCLHTSSLSFSYLVFFSVLLFNVRRQRPSSNRVATLLSRALTADYLSIFISLFSFILVFDSISRRLFGRLGAERLRTYSLPFSSFDWWWMAIWCFFFLSSCFLLFQLSFSCANWCLKNFIVLLRRT